MFKLKNVLMDEETGAAGGPSPTPEAPPESANQSPAAPPDDWKSVLPEGVAEWQEVQTSKTPEDLWKQMEHYRSSYGRSIRVPGEDAGPEDRQKFLNKLREAAPELVPAPDMEDQEAMDSLYATLGRPESADGYRVAEEISQNVNEDLLTVYKNAAHKSGLSQKQMESVMGAFLEAESQMISSQQEKLQEGNQALNQEWGLATERNRKSAATIAERFGFTQDVINAIQSGAMGAENTKAFYAMAQATGSEGLQIANEQGAAAQIITPDEARMQIQEIQNNKDHAYWNPSSPAHKAARKKMRELHLMAQGGNNREVSLQAQTAGIGGGINYGE